MVESLKNEAEALRKEKKRSQVPFYDLINYSKGWNCTEHCSVCTLRYLAYTTISISWKLGMFSRNFLLSRFIFRSVYPCLTDSGGQRVISFPPVTNSGDTKISQDTT